MLMVPTNNIVDQSYCRMITSVYREKKHPYSCFVMTMY